MRAFVCVAHAQALYAYRIETKYNENVESHYAKHTHLFKCLGVLLLLLACLLACGFCWK